MYICTGKRGVITAGSEQSRYVLGASVTFKQEFRGRNDAGTSPFFVTAVSRTSGLW